MERVGRVGDREETKFSSRIIFHMIFLRVAMLVKWLMMNVLDVLLFLYLFCDFYDLYITTTFFFAEVEQKWVYFCFEQRKWSM